MYSVTQNYSHIADWPIGRLQTELDTAWISGSSGTQPTPTFFPSLRGAGYVIQCTSVSGHGEIGQHTSGCNTNTGLVTSQVRINPQYLLTHHRAAQQKGWTLLILLILLFLWVKPGRQLSITSCFLIHPPTLRGLGEE